MNIFYLDKDPKICAQYHTDKHVVKMILESAQILCTAINETAGNQVTSYKSTHIHHPCVKWAMENYRNWSYVFNLMINLGKEWNFRYKHDKQHASIRLLCNSFIVESAIHYLPSRAFTNPPQCMPEEYKHENTIIAYRNYYKEGKKHLHKWTNREIPFFIT